MEIPGFYQPACFQLTMKLKILETARPSQFIGLLGKYGSARQTLRWAGIYSLADAAIAEMPSF